MALTTARIVATAMRLLERDGLEGVSFRKIGAELEVSAPTLYWHIDSKRRLLDLMAEELMARTEDLHPLQPSAGQPWWDWLERRTRAMYETMISHRDAPRVVAGNRPTVAALPAIDGYLTALVEAGFHPGEAIETILALGAFTTGCALEWQAEAERGLATTTDPELTVQVRSGAYPMVLTAFAEHRATHTTATPHDQMFEHGLRMMIDGLRARLERRQEASRVDVSLPGADAFSR